jgi:hypothetical protein
VATSTAALLFDLYELEPEETKIESMPSSLDKRSTLWRKIMISAQGDAFTADVIETWLG